MDKIRLWLKIERLRRRLSEVASIKSLADPKVITLSQQLDRLLNEYHALGKAA